MLRSLNTAATGMRAQETRIDVTANNLANVNTAGFKRSRAEFEDLLYDTLRPAGAESGAGTTTPTGLQVGLGARTVATVREHALGSVQQTNNPLDITIEGRGFFQIRQADGEPAYTRAGSFRADAQGNLVTPEGLPVEPGIVIPADAEEIVISPTGQVSVIQAGSVDPVQIGQIELATFVNPAGLHAIGRNLFLPTPASGAALTALPGSESAGTVLSGYLESSNVQVVEEMVDLITAQRAYETNSKVIRAADEMLQTTANLR